MWLTDPNPQDFRGCWGGDRPGIITWCNSRRGAGITPGTGNLRGDGDGKPEIPESSLSTRRDRIRGWFPGVGWDIGRIPAGRMGRSWNRIPRELAAPGAWIFPFSSGITGIPSLTAARGICGLLRGFIWVFVACSRLFCPLVAAEGREGAAPSQGFPV